CGRPRRPRAPPGRGAPPGATIGLTLSSDIPQEETPFGLAGEVLAIRNSGPDERAIGRAIFSEAVDSKRTEKPRQCYESRAISPHSGLTGPRPAHRRPRVSARHC